MKLITWIILTYTFFSVWTIVSSKEVYGFQEKNIFSETKIVFDYEPIKNNSLIYAACDIETKGTEMNCSIVLEYFPKNREVFKKVCQIQYQAKENTSINKDQFQLKQLYNDRAIFVSLDRHKTTEDLSVSVEDIVLRIVDMSRCKVVEKRISYEVVPLLRNGTDDFHVVPYENTFNLFFYNVSLCGDKMCGQTYDIDGSLINGPVSSYLPSKLFNKPVLVYPAKPRSPFMGHFLLSSKLYLVSSYYGKVTELMDYPSGIDVLAFSCDNGYLGFCWMSRYNERNINCTQFNVKGNKTMSIIVELEYKPGTWMDMYNLEDGGMLVLTSQCDDDVWCNRNVDSVAFYAVEVHKDGRVEEVHEIRGVDCNYVQDIKTDIIKKDNGDVCITFACHVSRNDVGESHVNLLSKCITKI